MKKYSILYVDDEESNLRIFKDTFRRKFNVFVAISAKDGIKILESESIDVILSDQRMPEMTGVEFLKYSFEKFPKINRILVTGYSDFGAVEDAINQARVFQYIQKPWNEDALVRTIDDALKIHRLEQENIKQNEELIVAKEKAEENDRLKTEFIRSMSHEIRTPMNGIMGFTTFLENPDLSIEERKQYIRIIRKCGTQLLRIIDDILEISKLKTNQVKVIEEEVCLNTLLKEIAVVFDISAKEKNLNLAFNRCLSDSETTIITDKYKLNKILLNLVENAIKFTKEGGVEFGCRLLDKQLIVYIRDTGIGIAPEKEEIIFERFTQGNENISLEYGGLGLGLSIAKENSELLNGSIEMQSSLGFGTEFTLSIPYKRSASNTISSKASRENITVNDGASKFNILVAEDDDTNREYLTTLLKTEFDITNSIYLAKNGAEAVDICRQQTIDLVFMDLQMPILNGFGATKEIKALNKNIVVIAQTAYTTIEEQERAIAAGCDAFITKPIKKTELQSVLSKCFVLT